MDNRSTKQPLTGESSNNITVGKFALLNQPVDYQITVHINNLIITYGKYIIKDFKSHLYEPNDLSGLVVRQLCDHYGIDKMRQWFTLIYGWDFTEKAG
jgi:hypothetical protein